MPFVPWAIALHGGAGDIPRNMPVEQLTDFEKTLEDILDAGIEALTSSNEGLPSRSALDVVELVVRRLEDSPLFNAGRGSVLTSAESVEMEACIMDSNRVCGAVSGLTTVKNPISLARLVMEKTPHVYLAFDGAEKFADSQGVERMPPDWFIVDKRRQQLRDAKLASNDQLNHPADTDTGKRGIQASGMAIPANSPHHSMETVGCVVVDSSGCCAAATSTGGLTNKMVGRIGDTPVVGAGNYANKLCAVSATGKGEHIIRGTVARDVAAVMEYRELPLADAAGVVMNGMPPGTCGLVAVSSKGDLTLNYNTTGFFRAYSTAQGDKVIKVWGPTSESIVQSLQPS